MPKSNLFQYFYQLSELNFELKTVFIVKKNESKFIRQMKKNISMVIVGILCLLSPIVAQPSISKWQAQPIKIDGDATDWQSLPRFFNSESAVQYEFRNDAQNLYLILKSADQATKLQLAQAGFTIHLKEKTQPPTKFSITFPARKMETRMNFHNNPEEKPELLNDKYSTPPEIILRDSAILAGFMYTKGIIYSDKNDTNGFCFAQSKNNRKQTIFEIQIPLREIFGSNFNLVQVSKTAFQLQVIINDLSLNSMQNKHGRMGERGMQNGMGRNGRMGGMNGGEMRERNDQGGGMYGESNGLNEQENMSGGNFSNNSSLGRKSFSIDFVLSTSK